jgi:hypothetical protein
MLMPIPTPDESSRYYGVKYFICNRDFILKPQNEQYYAGEIMCYNPNNHNRFVVLETENCIRPVLDVKPSNIITQDDILLRNPSLLRRRIPADIELEFSSVEHLNEPEILFFMRYLYNQLKGIKENEEREVILQGEYGDRIINYSVSQDEDDDDDPEDNSPDIQVDMYNGDVWTILI